MAIILDRLARIVPPRSGQCRAVACNNATNIVELDNDIFQLAEPSGPGHPGSYGPALMRCHAEGADIYVLFNNTGAGTFTANSAAVAGANVCDRVPAGQERDFEISPTIDKFMSANTINGGALTATLRYRIVSFPLNANPAQG